MGAPWRRLPGEPGTPPAPDTLTLSVPMPLKVSAIDSHSASPSTGHPHPVGLRETRPVTSHTDWMPPGTRSESPGEKSLIVPGRASSPILAQQATDKGMELYSVNTSAPKPSLRTRE